MVRTGRDPAAQGAPDPRVDPRAGHPAGLGIWPRTAPVIRTAAAIAFVVIALGQSSDIPSLLALASTWALANVGLALVLGAAGQISLCQASLVLAGGYLYGLTTLTWGESPLLGVLAGTVAGGAAALIISPVLRTRGYLLALATIAVSLAVTQLATTGHWLPGGPAGLIGVPPLSVGSFTFETPESYLWLSIVLLAVIIVGLHLRYGRGARRRAIALVHHDEDLLAAFGIDSRALKRRVFVIGGLLSGLAGALYAAQFGYISSSGFDLNESFALVLAVLIGGSGRLLGAVLGTLIYECTFVVLGPNLSEYRFAILGAVVILTVHFFPHGLLPTRLELISMLPAAVLSRLPALASDGTRKRGSIAVSVAELEPDTELEPVKPLTLTIDRATKRFGALAALDGLSVVVQPGSLTALIGPNGAGKTTLLDLIAGDQNATSGSITIDGMDSSGADRSARARAGVARTYQRLRLIGTMSVLDNVLLGSDLAATRSDGHQAESTRRASARTTLRKVGLAERADDRVDELPFGQRRLVEIARALAARPRMLLLDEPSSGLDDSEVPAFAEIVRRIHRSGCTILLVEHNLPFVRALAEDVIALDRGRLLAHGPTEDVFELPAFQSAYVGESVAR